MEEVFLPLRSGGDPDRRRVKDLTTNETMLTAESRARWIGEAGYEVPMARWWRHRLDRDKAIEKWGVDDRTAARPFSESVGGGRFVWSSIEFSFRPHSRAAGGVRDDAGRAAAMERHSLAPMARKSAGDPAPSSIYYRSDARRRDARRLRV